MKKVCILCGGTGTRLREQTEFLPKPLIQVGGKPIIWHIMKHYAHYGYNSFVLALGYKQEAFKEYFSHFNEINNDCIVDVGRLQGITCKDTGDNWRIVLSDTGLNTLKGGRLKRIQKYLDHSPFFMTYGDAVSDVDIDALLKYHNSHGKIATVTGVPAPPRFGELNHSKGTVSFSEKPPTATLINGGFFVFNYKIFDYLTDNCDLEIGPLEALALKGELKVYHHKGYWGCCDTLRDLDILQEEWNSGKPKWRVWA